ncbi:unnamed protein product [Owenia fusiformis]|uniref:Roc domain-containing protein n=1 Tax=Owenia fusiformis TaxID=6347 RepID=A0A8S4NVV5_OWEFU|nr:unnamed protein product [Owenia fusiformis]
MYVMMDGAALAFGKDSTVQDIKEKIIETPTLTKLELNECIHINDTAIADVAETLTKDLQSLIVRKGIFTDKGVEFIAKRCQQLQNVKFIGCNAVGEDGMKSLGRHCNDLRTVAFIYEVNTEWHIIDKSLSVLAKSISAEINSIAFVGFDEITDLGVNYVADGYQNTLNQVNFSHCGKITDDALITLAKCCKGLRDIELNSTNITDKGVSLLASKCSQLEIVNFGNCLELSDSSIENLAKGCPKLTQLNVESCYRITELSLASLAKGCLELEVLNFDQTSIRTIPVLIVGLRKLSILSLHACRELYHPPPEVIDRQIDGLLEFYKEYSLAYRLKVFLLGDQNVGKTTLASALVGSLLGATEGPTEGVNIDLWHPFVDSQNEKFIQKQLRQGEKNLTFDIWDLSGRPVLQGAHQAYMTNGAIYIVVFNLSSDASCNSVASYLDAVQTKAPGSHVILAATHADKLNSEDQRKAKIQGVLLPIQELEKQKVTLLQEEIDSLKQFGKENVFLKRIEEVKYVLKHQLNVPNSVISVNAATGKGVDEIKTKLFTKALDPKTFPHLIREIKPGLIQLYDEILKLRQKGTLLMTWKEFKEMAMCEERIPQEEILEGEIEFLHTVGGVLDFKFSENRNPSDPRDRVICIYPYAFAESICATIVDNDKQAFRFEARRFWPKESGYPKPDPAILVRVLEEIPLEGLVRMSLLPLIWQDFNITDEQAVLMVETLGRLSLLSKAEASKTPTKGLALPHFKSLSTQSRYYIPLMNLMPDIKPQLNWTPTPFKGDLQIGWRYDFPTGVPPGLLLRALANVKRASSEFCNYQHCWRNGVLSRIDEVSNHVLIVQ